MADAIGGWLTEQQGQLLWREVTRLSPGGTVVEIGSHQGRSTVVLGMAAEAVGAGVTAIDPFVEGAMFGGAATRGVFERNIVAAGLTDVVTLQARPSRQVRETWSRPIDVLYVDGKHDYWTVVDDLRWLELCASHAHVLIHDSFCSVGVTSALADQALVRGRLRYVCRVGTMALFDLAPVTRDDRRRLVGESRWFAGNVTIKAARRLHAQGVLDRLGHTDPHDPY